MKTEMSKSGFKARALQVFRHIERTGEPVIITDHGEPTPIIRRYSPAAVPLDSGFEAPCFDTTTRSIQWLHGAMERL